MKREIRGKNFKFYSGRVRNLLILLLLVIWLSAIVSAVDITGSQTISSSGLYNVVNDISCPSSGTCIDVQSDNVVIDGKNHVLQAHDSNWYNYGIDLHSHKNIQLKNIQIKGFSNDVEKAAGLRIGGGSSVDLENIVLSENSFGLQVGWYGSNQLLRDSVIRNNTYGIVLDGFLESFNNTISSNNHGIVMDNFHGGNKAIIYQNRFINNTIEGIYLSSDTGHTIYDNIFDGNGEGIFINSLNADNPIFNNTFRDNSEGIRIANSQLANITKNTILSSHSAGVYLATSSHNKITGNSFIGNAIGTSFLNSNNNNLSDNYFNNTEQNVALSLGISNLWNTTNSTGPNIVNGSFIGGNFWADPSGTGHSQTCTDSDGNGFCDASYVIDIGNVDHLPLHSSSTITHTIAATAGTGGVISPTGAVSVAHGSSRTFTITPDSGYTIHDVVVDGVSEGPISTRPFTNVVSDHTIHASFTPISPTNHTITASAGIGGTISPNGSVIVAHGSSQSFSITPDSGYTIQDVVVDGVSEGPVSTRPFTNVVSDHTIHASFTLISPTNHTITATAGTGGTISPTGAVPVAHGSSQNFTITPGNGYIIQDVVVDSVSEGPISTRLFTNVISDHTIHASFTPISPTNHTITATAGIGGTISPTGAVPVAHGSSQNFTITPGNGYTIQDVVVDGISEGPVSTRLFSNVASDHTIHASFTPISPTNHTIIASAGPGGSITPSGSVSVAHESNLTFIITPDSGFIILDVMVDGSSAGPVPSYQFTNVTTNHTIAASFQPVTQVHYILASAGTGGFIEPSGLVPVVQNSSKQFNITASPCYSISDVLVNGTSQGPWSTWVFDNVVTNHTIQVEFSLNYYNITASAGDGGSITPSGTVTVPCGNSQSFTITPDSKFVISDIIVDGSSVGVLSSFTFINVTSNHSIHVTFTPEPVDSHLINSTANEWSLIYPNGNKTYPANSNQTFLTQAKPGATLINVQVDEWSMGPIDNWTFTNLSEDHSIHAMSNPTPGQIHVFFSATPRYGEMPLFVSFNSSETLGEPTSWFWQFGDGKTSNESNPHHTYNIPGSYSVTLRAQNNQTGGYAQWNRFITVTDGPVPEPTPTPVPGEIIPRFAADPEYGTVPLSVQFTDESSGNPTEWFWEFGDGEISTERNPIHIYMESGTYPVKLYTRNSFYSGRITVPDKIVVL